MRLEQPLDFVFIDIEPVVDTLQRVRFVEMLVDISENIAQLLRNHRAFPILGTVTRTAILVPRLIYIPFAEYLFNHADDVDKIGTGLKKGAVFFIIQAVIQLVKKKIQTAKYFLRDGKNLLRQVIREKGRKLKRGVLNAKIRFVRVTKSVRSQAGMEDTRVENDDF